MEFAKGLSGARTEVRWLSVPSVTPQQQPMRDPQSRLRTGISGLDDVLYGGLTPNRLYLVEGMPGSGKTTLALQFLLEGVRSGEPVLYVTLSETAEEINAVADSHGWTLDGVYVRELMPAEELLRAERAVHGVPSVRGRALGDDEEDPVRCRARQAAPRRLRFAVRAAPARRATRCATGGRSSRSSSIFAGRSARCCCSTT